MSKLVSTTTEKPDSSKSSSNAVIFVIKVVIYILNLILSGKSETEAIRTASVKHNIPVSKVKDIWKNHK
ncbi:hypothetical protein [Ruminococcus flavefaciens]|uniref:hypothetical protein n=1 Tax=Ruminococcus flavefaciens TaxID=1265 RepID=UPI000465D6C5|nr:hypothetical protein [Ruminococcus flavefaciens]